MGINRLALYEKVTAYRCWGYAIRSREVREMHGTREITEVLTWRGSWVWDDLQRYEPVDGYEEVPR